VTAARPNPVREADKGASDEEAGSASAPRQGAGKVVAEIGGPKGPEPTRYGDWERNGRCSDF
jgi:hypothetical protein